jgi:carbohydrate-selective porin OprB
MRHFSGRLGVILIGAIWAMRSSAADTIECSDCAVANALASALRHDDRAHSGLRAAGGYWLFNAQFDDLETAGIAGPARLRGDNSGTYLHAADSRALGGGAEHNVRLFLHERSIEDAGNPLGEYVGAGVVYESAAAEGWRRQFGIAVGVAELATPLQRALSSSGIDVAEREAIYELSYRIELSDGFAVQSDLQFVRNPGMDARVDSSWAVGLRFEFAAR